MVSRSSKVITKSTCSALKTIICLSTSLCLSLVCIVVCIHMNDSNSLIQFLFWRKHNSDLSLTEYVVAITPWNFFNVKKGEKYVNGDWDNFCMSFMIPPNFTYKIFLIFGSQKIYFEWIFIFPTIYCVQQQVFDDVVNFD